MKKSRRGTVPLALVFALIGSVPACVDEHVSPIVTEASIEPYLEFAQFLTFGIPDDGGGVVITAVHPDEMGLEYRGAMTVPGTEMLAYRGPLIPREYLYARAILQGMSTERSSYMVFVRDPERMADRIPPEMEITGVFPVKGGGVVYQGVMSALPSATDEPSVDHVGASSANCRVSDWKNPPGADEYGLTGPKTARAREYKDYIDCIRGLLDLIKDEPCVVAKSPVWNPETKVYDMEAVIVCDPLL